MSESESFMFQIYPAIHFFKFFGQELVVTMT